MKAIGVVGAGSWGTALAINLGAAGSQVVLWARRAEMADQLDRERRSPYLPESHIPATVRITADLAELAACDPIILAVPSHGTRIVLRELLAGLPAGAPVVLVSATKGVEPDSLARMSEVCAQEGERSGHAVRFASLGGPTFAAEVAAARPSLAAVASADPTLAAELQERFGTPSLRLYTSSDVVGVELGGTTKNVIAIAAGTVIGLGLGHNTLAALITRGLHEITRLGVAWGGEPHTFSGLAGLGDLVLTCTGGLSRNRHVGLELAKGRTLQEISASTSMVAEGVRNSVAVQSLAQQRDVEMPITEQMVAVLYHGKTPRQALEELMRRSPKSESAL